MLVRFKALLLYTIVLISVLACNPFAPGLDEISIDRNKLLGDRSTLTGFFSWFRNAYELRDSTLYGQIISNDFRFTFLDFSKNVETYWDRDVEMKTTHNMFRNVKQASLQWNNFVYADTSLSDTVASVERYFNITIIQDDQNIYRGTGSARLLLKRKAKGEPWRIAAWYDRSDF
jgi:hypothetical protein